MKATAVIVFLIGFGCALNTASCASKNSCADSGGAGGSSGSAGSGGSSGDCSSSANAGSAGAATTCAMLTALNACLSAFCKADGAQTPFCSCYLKGYDLRAAPKCDCAAFNTPETFSPANYCAQAEAVGASPSDLDCAATTSPLTSMCIGVQ